jgi:hypothetical protein
MSPRPKNGGAVRNHGHQVGPPGELEGFCTSFWISRQEVGDAGGIGQGQILPAV